MREKVVAAALIAAAIYYVLSVSAKWDSETEYKDIHEQIQMERLITNSGVEK